MAEREKKSKRTDNSESRNLGKDEHATEKRKRGERGNRHESKMAGNEENTAISNSGKRDERGEADEPRKRRRRKRVVRQSPKDLSEDAFSSPVAEKSKSRKFSHGTHETGKNETRASRRPQTDQSSKDVPGKVLNEHIGEKRRSRRHPPAPEETEKIDRERSRELDRKQSAGGASKHCTVETRRSRKRRSCELGSDVDETEDIGRKRNRRTHEETRRSRRRGLQDHLPDERRTDDIESKKSRRPDQKQAVKDNPDEASNHSIREKKKKSYKDPRPPKEKQDMFEDNGKQRVRDERAAHKVPSQVEKASELALALKGAVCDPDLSGSGSYSSGEGSESSSAPSSESKVRRKSMKMQLRMQRMMLQQQVMMTQAVQLQQQAAAQYAQYQWQQYQAQMHQQQLQREAWDAERAQREQERRWVEAERRPKRKAEAEENIRRVLQRLRDVTPRDFATVKKDVDDVLDRELSNLGSRRNILEEEAAHTLKLAKRRVEKATEALAKDKSFTKSSSVTNLPNTPVFSKAKAKAMQSIASLFPLQAKAAGSTIHASGQATTKAAGVLAVPLLPGLLALPTAAVEPAPTAEALAAIPPKSVAKAKSPPEAKPLPVQDAPKSKASPVQA